MPTYTAQFYFPPSTYHLQENWLHIILTHVQFCWELY